MVAGRDSLSIAACAALLTVLSCSLACLLPALPACSVGVYPVVANAALNKNVQYVGSNGQIVSATNSGGSFSVSVSPLVLPNALPASLPACLVKASPDPCHHGAVWLCASLPASQHASKHSRPAAQPAGPLLPLTPRLLLPLPMLLLSLLQPSGNTQPIFVLDLGYTAGVAGERSPV
jgi:hypothetical protein